MNYNHSKVGNWLCKILYRDAMFLAKHKVLYYFLNLTWGIIMTLIGYITALVLLICGKKPTKYYGTFYFSIGKNWGGVSLGTIFLRDITSAKQVCMHELGHTYQNAILGPFMIFMVAIPSAIRYWYREINEKAKATPYDAIWFEDSATCIGNSIVNKEGDK